MSRKNKYEFKTRSGYPKYLFHRTQENNINNIMLSNKLTAGSRSQLEDNRVSMSTGTDGSEFGPITLVIDADRLREDYLVRQFDYDKSMGQYAYEKEWYTDVDICNLSKYVVDIISDYDESYDRLYWYKKINTAVEKIAKLPSAENLKLPDDIQVVNYSLKRNNNTCTIRSTKVNTAMVEERNAKINHLISENLKFFPDADESILQFIANFLYHSVPEVPLDVSCESVRSTFRAGYCFYFAIMLRAAFMRGTVCHAYPFSHIVWVDDNGIPYDVEGVYSGEAEKFVPIEEIGADIVSFKHI